MKFSVKLSVLILLSILIIECKNENNETKFPSTKLGSCDSISFSKNVKPIIDLNCATSGSCHASGASNGDLTTYDKLVPYFASIKDRVLVQKDMPKGAVLTAEQLRVITCWYDTGNKNN